MQVEVKMCRDCWGGEYLATHIPLFVSDVTEQFVCPFCNIKGDGHVVLMVDEGVLMLVQEWRVTGVTERESIQHEESG